MNSINVNLHVYYSNNVFLQNFSWFNMSEFWIWLTKCGPFFIHYISTNASVLIFVILKNILKTFWKCYFQVNPPKI